MHLQIAFQVMQIPKEQNAILEIAVIYNLFYLGMVLSRLKIYEIGVPNRHDLLWVRNVRVEVSCNAEDDNKKEQANTEVAV